jgi:hypothetical protein
MRVFKPFWSKVKAALGALALAALPLAGATMLYRAATGDAVRPISKYSSDWITYQSDPGWFIATVVFYSIFVGLSVIFAVVMLVSWRQEKVLLKRLRNAPPVDDGIRIDVNAR